MPLSHLRLTEITEEHIQSLIDAPSPEGQRIDYKRTVIGKEPDARRDLLKDVAAFANADGGDIVLGIEEKEGNPAVLVGLPDINPDDEIRRLHSILQNGIDPPVTPVIRSVPVSQGGNVIIIRVPRSWAAPHMVTFGNEFRFWARLGSQKEAMRVDELRRSFAGYDLASERVRAFVEARVKTTHAPPIRIDSPGGKWYMHVVPLSIANPRERFDLGEMAVPDPRLHPPSDPHVLGWTPQVRYTADGILLAAGDNPRNYVLAFRNGVVELVDATPFNPPDSTASKVPFFFVELLEDFAVEKLSSFLDFQCALGVRPPLVCTISLDAQRSRLLPRRCAATPSTVRRLGTGIDRAPLTGPEIVIDDWVSSRGVPNLLRPAFDFVWNAAGRARSLSYNETGEWTENEGD